MEEQLNRWLTATPTRQIARELLGATLQVAGCAGLIVETEAYLGETDRAAHAFGGRRTKTNGALWAPAGTVYVYQMRQYCLLNLVTQPRGVPQCVLIRAIEPTLGRSQMMLRRNQTGAALTSGPGKLCQALAITLADNGRLLGAGRIALRRAGRRPQTIAAAPRIGVPGKGAATSAPLRFYVAGNPYVSAIRKSQIHPNGGWQV